MYTPHFPTTGAGPYVNGLITAACDVAPVTMNASVNVWFATVGLIAIVKFVNGDMLTLPK